MFVLRHATHRGEQRTQLNIEGENWESSVLEKSGLRHQLRLNHRGASPRKCQNVRSVQLKEGDATPTVFHTNLFLRKLGGKTKRAALQI